MFGDGIIHNQYYGSQGKGAYWIKGGRGTGAVSADNGLATSSINRVSLGGTLTQPGIFAGQEKIDFSSYKSTWSGSVCDTTTRRHDTVTYKGFSNTSYFNNAPSRKPTKGSMGNNVKR